MTAPGTAVDSSCAVASAADTEVLDLSQGTLQLLLDSSQTRGAVSAHRCQLRDGAIGAPPHRHAMTSELLYVLSGAADVLAGDRLIRASKGDLIVAAPGAAHAFAAAPGSDAELFIVATPGIERFPYFRDLADVQAGRLEAASFMASQADYDTYPADPGPWARTAR